MSTDREFAEKVLEDRRARAAQQGETKFLRWPQSQQFVLPPLLPPPFLLPTTIHGTAKYSKRTTREQAPRSSMPPGFGRYNGKTPKAFYLQRQCNKSFLPGPLTSPTCLHFLRGHCSKPSCTYLHAPSDPQAMICRSFALDGFCKKGSACGRRHHHYCPDFANSGKCESHQCTLPHIDRIATLTKRSSTLKRPGSLSRRIQHAAVVHHSGVAAAHQELEGAGDPFLDQENFVKL